MFCLTSKDDMNNAGVIWLKIISGNYYISSIDLAYLLIKFIMIIDDKPFRCDRWHRQCFP